MSDRAPRGGVTAIEVLPGRGTALRVQTCSRCCSATGTPSWFTRSSSLAVAAGWNAPLRWRLAYASTPLAIIDLASIPPFVMGTFSRPRALYPFVHGSVSVRSWQLAANRLSSYYHLAEALRSIPHHGGGDYCEAQGTHHCSYMADSSSDRRHRPRSWWPRSWSRPRRWVRRQGQIHDRRKRLVGGSTRLALVVLGCVRLAWRGARLQDALARVLALLKVERAEIAQRHVEQEIA